MTFKERRADYLETLAAEISLTTGLYTRVVDGEYVEAETIAGKMKYFSVFRGLMQDVYRFVQLYGSVLHKYGLEQRLAAVKKERL